MAQLMTGPSERRFVIATNDYVDFVIFPPLIEALNKLAPNIQIHVKPTRSAVPYAAIDKKHVDIVIGFRAVLEPQSYFRQKTIKSDKLMCLVRKDHTVITGNSISFEQFLSSSHMVMSGHETGSGLIDNYLKELGVKRKVSLIMPTFLSAPRILANSDLVFSVALTLAEHFVQLAPLKMMPLPINCPDLDLIMVWHPLQEEEPAHEWLRQQILGTCHKLTG
jgi:DNA-binding transcriptional LysR family regulator